MNQPKDNYKNIKRKGDENPYSNPDVRAMNNNYNNHKSPKLINFLNNDNFEEDIKIYKLEDLDHPNGWNFSELDMLGEMNFRIDDDYKMFSEIEIPALISLLRERNIESDAVCTKRPDLWEKMVYAQ